MDVRPQARVAFTKETTTDRVSDLEKQFAQFDAQALPSRDTQQLMVASWKSVLASTSSLQEEKTKVSQSGAAAFYELFYAKLRDVSPPAAGVFAKASIQKRSRFLLTLVAALLRLVSPAMPDHQLVVAVSHFCIVITGWWCCGVACDAGRVHAEAGRRERHAADCVRSCSAGKSPHHGCRCSRCVRHCRSP